MERLNTSGDIKKYTIKLMGYTNDSSHCVEEFACSLLSLQGAGYLSSYNLI